MAAQSIKNRKGLAIDALSSQAPLNITVESAAFLNGGIIPETNSDYGDGRSPDLRWGDVPPGTKSIAVIAEDPDAHRSTPVMHWLVYNVPPTVHELPAAIPHERVLSQLDDAVQGRSSAGSIGYFGPHPPRNDLPHHYHFEVFCLDTPLDLGPETKRNELLSAMAGHVLAKGELVATYQAPRA